MTIVNAANLEIGSRLRHARKVRSLSQQQVADILGITFQQVQKYESGKNRISTASSKILKDRLGIDLLPTTETDDIRTQLDFTETEMLHIFRRVKNPAVKAVMVKLLREFTEE